MGAPGNCREADIALRHALHGDETAGDQLEIFGTAFKDFGGLFFDLTLDLGRCPYNGNAGHVGHAARGCTPIIRRAIGVWAGDTDPIERDLQCLRAHLAENCIRSLPDIDCAGVEQHGAVFQQPDDRSGR